MFGTHHNEPATMMTNINRRGLKPQIIYYETDGAYSVMTAKVAMTILTLEAIFHKIVISRQLKDDERAISYFDSNGKQSI